jgi:hypothetical protein
MRLCDLLDKDFDPTNAANQDIDLSVKANLNESFSATVKTNIHSNYLDSMVYFKPLKYVTRKQSDCY